MLVGCLRLSSLSWCYLKVTAMIRAAYRYSLLWSVDLKTIYWISAPVYCRRVKPRIACFWIAHKFTKRRLNTLRKRKLFSRTFLALSFLCAGILFSQTCIIAETTKIFLINEKLKTKRFIKFNQILHKLLHRFNESGSRHELKISFDELFGETNKTIESVERTLQKPKGNVSLEKTLNALKTELKKKNLTVMQGFVVL